jgi:hypothetical protein
MPLPRRSQDEIASVHLDTFALDGGESSVACPELKASRIRDAVLGGWGDVDGVSRTLDDETTGESSMSVSWSGLTRHDEL